VFFTQGKGWGLRTLDELSKGAFVCEYVGELLTSTELHERTSQNMHNGRHMHPVLLDANWGSEGVLKDEEALCLDATFYGNVGRFINHRCDVIFPFPFVVVLFDSKHKPYNWPLIFLFGCNILLCRCYDANLIEIPVEVETPDHHYYRVRHLKLLRMFARSLKQYSRHV
jgi:SET domain-containing protein